MDQPTQELHLVVVAIAAVVPPVLGTATAAGAARFAISVQGRDVLAWTVGQSSDECGRRGSGRQTVEFTDPHPGHGPDRPDHGSWQPSACLSAWARRRADPRQGHHGARRQHHRQFTFHEHCESIPAKDCGTQPLPHFEPSLNSDSSAGFTFHGPYYPTGNPPFHNCLALVTPVNLVGVETFYSGWNFGEEILTREATPMATRPVSPQSLRVGRTYHFTAHKIVQISDSDLHGFVISDDGGTGPPEVEIGEPESPHTDDTLGGGRSITDTASWEITLKRVS